MTTSTENTKIATMNDLFYDRFVKEVTEDEREDFIMTKFNNSIINSLMFEQNVYGITNHSCKDYDGGYWEFANLNQNKGFFMHLNKEERFTLQNLNYQQAYSVDGRILGLIMCIMLYSQASFTFFKSKPDLSKLYSEHYHNLRGAFYSTVDSMAYGVPDENGDYVQDDSVSEEIRAEIKEMASVVHSYLD